MFHLYCRARQVATLSEQSMWHERLTGTIGFVLQLCGWLLFAAGCFVLGGYAYQACQERRTEVPTSPDYYQTQEHFVFKKKPLPVPEEVSVDEEQESRPAAEAPTEPVAEEGDSANAELKRRVKEAMAELDSP
ncbi:hypothetical protein TA05_02400 [Citrobacter rodentium]|uniref:T2SS component n=2 Tax=Citrobacter rodentium TaxID=67825 RepID=D2TMI1_CITRI|nr:hypothetical protein TA05_02400 [Citrobacter rodentium]CBG91195.1 putative T2SS component [Citrobacter rodentium ICC168]